MLAILLGDRNGEVSIEQMRYLAIISSTQLPQLTEWIVGVRVLLITIATTDC